MRILFLSLLTLLTLVFPALSTEETPTLGLVGSDYPLVNESTKIIISHASYPDLSKFKIEITYRPNSSTSHTEMLNSVNSDGYAVWTPKTAGIANIKAIAPGVDSTKKEIILEKSVSVRFGTFPLSGLLIFGLAALILFGGLTLLILINTKPPPKT